MKATPELSIVTIYGMLRDAGIIDAALSAEVRGRESREKLIERVAIAYLRDQDNLARFSFDHAGAEDLQHAAWFMGSLRGETVSKAQRTKILEFFDRSVTWAQAQAAPPGELLSSLAGLAWVLGDADGRRRELLLVVAPYVKRHHRTHDFLLELARLIEVSRDGVAEVLEKLVETHREPFYDYEDRLKAVIRRLFELGAVQRMQKKFEAKKRRASRAKSGTQSGTHAPKDQTSVH